MSYVLFYPLKKPLKFLIIWALFLTAQYNIIRIENDFAQLSTQVQILHNHKFEGLQKSYKETSIILSAQKLQQREFKHFYCTGPP